MNVKEFVNTCKTATGHIQKVAHIPLLLTPCWLELSHMTTHSQGELGCIVFVVVARHPTKNGWSVTMGGKRYRSKVSASKEANAQICWWGKKRTLWNIIYVLGKRKTCFSSLASLKMLMTDGRVKNTGQITAWIHSRQLIDADLNGHGGWEVIERIFASPVIVVFSRWLNYW